MTYFNVKVEVADDGKYKAQIPGTRVKAVCNSFYDLQVRLYEYLDKDDWKDFKLLFLLSKPLQNDEH